MVYILGQIVEITMMFDQIPLHPTILKISRKNCNSQIKNIINSSYDDTTDIPTLSTLSTIFPTLLSVLPTIHIWDPSVEILAMSLCTFV